MRRVLFGFVAAAAVFGGFLAVFDPGAMWATLRAVKPLPVVAGLLAVLLSIVCWAESMRRILSATGDDLTPLRGFRAYGAGMFAKQILPLGNAGGVPLMAYAIDREADLGFNRSLAVVTVGDFLGLVSSLALALVGVGYVVLYSPGTALLRVALVGIGVFAVVLLSLSVLLFFRRGVLRAGALGVARLLRGTLGTVSRRVEARLAPERVAAGLPRSFETFDAVRADGRSVLVAAALSLVGWTLFAVPLYTSALAVGEPLPFGLVLFVVQVGAIAAVVPLPGGIGGVEFAVAGALATLTTVDLAVAGAIVLLYRACVYWFPILVGGICVVFSTASVATLASGVDAGSALPDDPDS